MKEIMLIYALLFGKPTDQLRIQEAEAFVHFHEAKVALIEAKHEKDLLRATHTHREWQRFKRAHIAISDAEVADAEYYHKDAELDCKVSEAEIKQAKAELEIAKIRLQRMQLKDHSSTHLN